MAPEWWVQEFRTVLLEPYKSKPKGFHSTEKTLFLIFTATVELKRHRIFNPSLNHFSNAKINYISDKGDDKSLK